MFSSRSSLSIHCFWRFKTDKLRNSFYAAPLLVVASTLGVIKPKEVVYPFVLFSVHCLFFFIAPISSCYFSNYLDTNANIYKRKRDVLMCLCKWGSETSFFFWRVCACYSSCTWSSFPPVLFWSFHAFFFWSCCWKKDRFLPVRCLRVRLDYAAALGPKGSRRFFKTTFGEFAVALHFRSPSRLGWDNITKTVTFFLFLIFFHCA